MIKRRKKELIGKVLSTKNDKTITVVVDTYKKHPLYLKRFKSSKKFAAHDEKEIAKVNDIVSIIESRTFSKTKHFRINRVIKTSQEGNK